MVHAMSRKLVRGIFGLVLVSVAVHLGVAKVWTEPYPALFQPGFGGFGGRQGQPDTMTTAPQEAVVVTYADGGTASFSHLEVMRQSKSGPLAVFRSAFVVDSRRRSDPRTVAWLEQRLADLGGGRRPVRAVITGCEVTYDVYTRQPLRATTTDTVTVSFPGGDGRG
jgi:hypothetical protein